VSGFGDFMAQLQQQAITREQGRQARATARAGRLGPRPATLDRKKEVAEGVAIQGGKVGPGAFMDMSVPEAVDTMSMVPLAMEDLRLDDDIQRLKQDTANFLYPPLPPGQVTVYPADVIEERDLAPAVVQRNPPTIIPNANPNAQLPRAGQWRAPYVGPGANPVQQAYGHIDDAVNKFGPDATYGALAEDGNPLEYMRLLAGQLAARRQRLLGTDQDPMTGFDPVLIGAMGGPGPSL
jgi:hypothetical protein